MKSEGQTSKKLRELAAQALDIVVANSGGDISRGINWQYFVSAIPNDDNLRELAEECFDALPDDQKRVFLGHINRQQTHGDE